MDRIFPNATLRTDEATPRITPDHAKEVCELIEKLSEVQTPNPFPQRPAICVAVFTEMQVKWLIEDLQASTATWKFVSHHHPPFTSGGNYYTKRRIELKNLLPPIFEKYGVDIAFHGHDHDYERTVPIVSEQGVRPVTYVVTGNGGTPLACARAE